MMVTVLVMASTKIHRIRAHVVNTEAMAPSTSIRRQPNDSLAEGRMSAVPSVMGTLHVEAIAANSDMLRLKTSVPMWTASLIRAKELAIMPPAISNTINRKQKTTAMINAFLVLCSRFNCSMSISADEWSKPSGGLANDSSTPPPPWRCFCGVTATAAEVSL